jgi:uncharacterized protein YegP (UPF0339 family)
MKKKYHFLIKDARGGFRVHQVAPNGEIINSSQVLDTVDNVYKNIIAAMKVTYLIGPSVKFQSMKARKACIQDNMKNIPFVHIAYDGKKNIGLEL